MKHGADGGSVRAPVAQATAAQLGAGSVVEAHPARIVEITAMDQPTSETESSFVVGYFKSRVSALAGVLLWVAVSSAGLSYFIEGWWQGYLQSLSTTFLGIAATVWLLNYFIEDQNRRIAAELGRRNETAALRSLRRTMPPLLQILPQGEVPDLADNPQIAWARQRVDHVLAACERVDPGASDRALQEAVDEFRSRGDAWAETVEMLERLIREIAPAGERRATFSALRETTRQFQSDATTLIGRLEVSLGLEGTEPGHG